MTTQDKLIIYHRTHNITNRWYIMISRNFKLNWTWLLRQEKFSFEFGL